MQSPFLLYFVFFLMLCFIPLRFLYLLPIPFSNFICTVFPFSPTQQSLIVGKVTEYILPSYLISISFFLHSSFSAFPFSSNYFSFSLVLLSSFSLPTLPPFLFYYFTQARYAALSFYSIYLFQTVSIFLLSLNPSSLIIFLHIFYLHILFRQ